MGELRFERLGLPFNLIGSLAPGYYLAAMQASFRGEAGKVEHTEQFLDDFFNAFDGCFFE